jgi:hypothetical protein
MKLEFALASVCGAFVLGLAMGQDDPAGGAQEPAPAQTPEDPWLAAGRPGEVHRTLDPLVGEFDVEMRFFGGPEPIEQRGSWRSEWTLDGRYVEARYEAEYMGEAFVGKSLMGYSNADQTYKSVWWDSLSTNIDYSVGYASPDGTRLTMLGSVMNPATGAVEEYQDEFELAPDRYSFARTMLIDGQKTRSMEGVFTRRQPKPR